MKVGIFGLLGILFVIGSCGVVNKNGCGCPAKKGFVGY